MSQTTIDGGGPGGSFVDGSSVVDATVMEALRANIPDAESRLAALEAVAPSTSAVLLKAAVTLNNTQTKALPTTAVTLVAAPAAGFRNKVLAVSFSGHFSAGAYTNLDAVYAALFVFHLGDTSQWLTNPIVKDTTVSITRLADFLAAGDQLVDAGPYQDSPSDGNAALNWVLPNVHAAAAAEATAIAVMMDNNGSGDLTGGNVANTLKITVYYVVEAL